MRGAFFYLYLILDLFSRKIVGWEVHAEEPALHTAQLFRLAYLREEVDGDTLTLHSDNGAPMKGATMLATRQRLGVVPSFSRPAVSNDNPYSEALFHTLNYTPAYPEGPFASLEAARAWVARFVPWYHEQHTATAPSGSSLRANVIAGRRSRCCDNAPPSMKPPRRNIRSAGPATSVTGSPSARCRSTRENRRLRRAATQTTSHS